MTPDRDLRYLRVPAAWEDTLGRRATLQREITRVHGEGWQVEAILPPTDAGRVVVLARKGHTLLRPCRQVETLAGRTADSVVGDFESRHARAGLTTVEWLPADRQCTAAMVPPTTTMIRNALAKRLKVNRVDLEVTVEWGLSPEGLGQVDRILVHRAPSVASSLEKRRETWVEQMDALVPLPVGDRWVYRELALEDRAIIVRRADPLRAILPAGDLDTSVEGVPDAVLGRSENATSEGADLTLNFATAATHIACQGQTRSGKSIFAYQLLSQLAASQSVIIAGCDPSGILLAPFVGTRHAGWQALGTKRPEDVLDVLGRVVNEMDARTVQLAVDLSDKLEVFTPERPLIMVVLEEYPGLRRAIEANDQASGGRAGTKLLPLVDLAISRILAEGAKVGVRVLIMAQRLDTTVLKGGDRANVPTRISFRVDKSEAIGMLHESLPPGMDVEKIRNFPPGVGLIESSVGGLPLVRFRAPMLDGGYAEYVRRIRAGSPLLVNAAAVTVDDEIIDLGELEFSLEDLEGAMDPLPDAGDDLDWSD